VRNKWLCDEELQAIMLSHLAPALWDRVDRWMDGDGVSSKPKKGKGKAPPKGKSATDGDDEEQFLELLRALALWWHEKFQITAPGLRKRGWMDLDRLDNLLTAFDDKPTDQNRFGERMLGIEGFRRCAQMCKGSRDVGAQLFTALLRALGIESRMIASLQPVGFGWSKFEEAEEGDSLAIEVIIEGKENARQKRARANKAASSGSHSTTPSRPTGGATKAAAVDVDDDSLWGSEPEAEVVKGKGRGFAYDIDLDVPHVWTEVVSPISLQHIPVDAIVTKTVCTSRELVEGLAPRGARAEKARQVMAYVVGYSPDGSAKDVTVRYLKGQIYPGRTKGVRFPEEKVPVYNRNGKVKRYDIFDWFKSAMRRYQRGEGAVTVADDLEDETDLVPLDAPKKEVKPGDETLQYYKESDEFILLRHLKREEAMKAGAKPVRKFFNRGRGGGGGGGGDDVFLRSDVVAVKSAETWHKQGREPRPGEQPLKLVPYRAATLNRKQAIIDTERETGEKVLQGLYSRAQTDWIVPPPIQNGVIPKNEYGNIDMFVSRMCPKGAVHLPYRGCVRVCKRLEIDFAEAVVGFEFGHKMAVPVIHGVVVAEEHKDVVLEELEKDEAARQRRDDEKRKEKALGLWRKFIMGMRIVARIQAEYGDVKDGGIDVFGKKRAKKDKAGVHVEIGDERIDVAGEEDESLAGGFLPEGFGEDDVEHDEAEGRPVRMGRSHYFAGDGDEDDEDDDLLVEHG
jgi:xeroderma pigmentosum group C-complementing protein